MCQLLSFLDTRSPFWSQPSQKPTNLTNDLLILKLLKIDLSVLLANMHKRVQGLIS